MELEDYLDALASEKPTPGGGSAAAIVGAFAAALVAMVARITRRSSSTSEADAVIARADTLRSEFALARTEDEVAYMRVVTAQALPKNTPSEKALRTQTLQGALAGAAEAPLRAAELAVRVLRLSEEAAALGNANLASDVACAKTFARASLTASAANVRINHAFLRDAELVRAQEARLRALELEAERE